MRNSCSIFIALCMGCGSGDSETGGVDDSDEPQTSTAGQVVGEGLSAALYSAWGTSASDVYMVGADDGSGPLVLHYDGSAWTRLDTGTTGDLWWVWGDGAGTVWIAGAGGRVVRHTIDTGDFEEHVVTGANITLFGIWGSAPDDLWTVGGDTNSGAGGTVVHYDGVAWTEADDLPAEPVAGLIYKVWGSASDDVWMVGTNALLMHRDGAGTWRVDPPPIYGSNPLFTVSGCGSEVVAVGGYGNAAIARNDGSGWVDDSPPPADVAPGFNGVVVDCTYGTYGVGNNGAVWRRDDAWAPTGVPPLTLLDFHGVWVDPDGGVWSVGGKLSAQNDGFVAYDGPDTIPVIDL